MIRSISVGSIMEETEFCDLTLARENQQLRRWSWRRQEVLIKEDVFSVRLDSTNSNSG